MKANEIDSLKLLDGSAALWRSCWLHGEQGHLDNTLRLRFDTTTQKENGHLTLDPVRMQPRKSNSHTARMPCCRRAA